MTPDDKRVARELLTSGRLTIDEVTRITAQVDATGRPFLETATQLGLLTPTPAPPPPPPSVKPAPPRPRPRVPAPFLWLFAGSLVFLLASSVLRLIEYRQRLRRDEDQAVETARFRTQADRQAADTERSWHLRNFQAQDARVRGKLAEARESMVWAETRIRTDPNHPELYVRLVRATLGFDSYLELHTDDAGVMVERSRAYELRGVHDRAVQDLEKAILIQKDLEPALAERLAQLRHILQRKR